MLGPKSNNLTSPKIRVRSQEPLEGQANIEHKFHRGFTNAGDTGIPREEMESED